MKPTEVVRLSSDKMTAILVSLILLQIDTQY